MGSQNRDKKQETCTCNEVVVELRLHYYDSILNSKWRFLLPVAFFNIARVVLISLIRGWNLVNSVMASDVLYNQMIASSGYGPTRSWTVMPLYPALIHFVSVPCSPSMACSTIAATAISWTLSTASVPIFQMIAENFMSRVEALNCSLLMFFFPWVMIFLSVGLSQSLLLLLELSVWALLKEQKYALSTLAAGMLSLTEIYGFAVSLMLVAELHRRGTRKLVYSLAPAILFLGWLLYVHEASGNWIHVLGSPRFPEFLLPLLGLSPLSLNPKDPLFLPVFSSLLLGFMLVVAFLALQSFTVNPALGAYAVASFVACLVLVPASFGSSIAVSLALIFPIWFVLRVKNVTLTLALVLSMLLGSFAIWSLIASA